MRVLITILIVFSLASCATQKWCSEKFPPSKYDGDTVIRETVTNYHDTVISIPGDVVYKQLFIRDTITFFDTVMRNNGTSLSLKIHSGILQATCKTDSLEKIITGLRSVIVKLNEQHINEKVVNVPVEVIKKRIPWWMWAILGINILSVGYKILQLFTPVAGIGLIARLKQLFKGIFKI